MQIVGELVQYVRAQPTPPPVQVAPVTAPPTVGRAPVYHVLLPKRYNRDPAGCNNFLMACKLYFAEFSEMTLVQKLMPLPTPHRSWSHIAVDFVTDLPISKGYAVILVVVDHFSKACRFIPFRFLPSALHVAKALFQHVFRCFGLLEEILSNQRLGVTSGYHPEFNSQAERSNQEFSRFLRAYSRNLQHDWAEFLTWAECPEHITSLCH